MSDIEQALSLQVMAEKDLRALKAMTDVGLFDDEIFGFHAQQAVEKSLKAWISVAGGVYGKSHDLNRLFLILCDLGCDIATFKDLSELTPFAVELRYEAVDSDEPELDRPGIIIRVQSLFDRVQAAIGIAQMKQ